MASPAASRPAVHLLPLGGLGEIGMNCLAIETEGRIVVIDCGVRFSDHEDGIDVIHPSFDWLRRRAEDVEAVVLTHGHEDHVGALPYLLNEIDVPVYAPRYARGVAGVRLEEYPPENPPEMLSLNPGQRIGLGPFEVEAYRVSHSIAFACGIILRCKGGTVVHSGDFKIEKNPPEGHATDEATLRALGEEGVDLLLSDSTNALGEGRCREEHEVQAGLIREIDKCEGRVAVALFSSNSFRLQAMVEAAKATRRKLCLLGRSLETHSRIAEEEGLLPDLASVLVPRDRASEIPPNQLLCAVTGTQGEPMAALGKIAAGKHYDVTFGAGDTVIFSARVIPGHEKRVWNIVDALDRRGVHVVRRQEAEDVHASGHARRDELRELLQWLRPKTFVPIHGTLAHLKAHEGLAREEGVRETRIVEDGHAFRLEGGRLKLGQALEVGEVMRTRGVEVPEGVHRERQRLGRTGSVIIAVPVDERGDVIGEISIRSRGFAAAEGPTKFRENLLEALDEALDRGGRGSVEGLLFRAARRWFRERREPNPFIDVVLVEVDD